MGSSESDAESDDAERPQHIVRIGYRFAIGRYPVTYEEYDHFCVQTGRQQPPDLGGRGRQPVIAVSWQDAQDYCAWLSRITGQTYRLPSEAEWEYACRAGTRTRYAFGDQITEVDANFMGSHSVRTTEVGSYLPNPWGLYDMHGNVLEWTQDRWHDTYKDKDKDAPTDGSPWLDEASSASADRICRGGSWSDDARHVRGAYRGHDNLDIPALFRGFRCAREFRCEHGR